MRTYTEVDTETLAERYWAKVEKGDGCWLWRGALNTWGYGSFWTGARAVGAHRWGYETFVGPIPDERDEMDRQWVRARAWREHVSTKRSHRQARRSSFDAGWDAALAARPAPVVSGAVLSGAQ